MFKNLMSKCCLSNSGEIRHILSSLLESYTFYMESMPYHGNINARSIAAVFSKKRLELRKKEKIRMMKKGVSLEEESGILRKEGALVNLLHFDFKLMFSHLDFFSKKRWLAKKIYELRNSKKLIFFKLFCNFRLL